MWAIFPDGYVNIAVRLQQLCLFVMGSWIGLSARRSISARPFLLFEGLG